MSWTESTTSIESASSGPMTALNESRSLTIIDERIMARTINVQPGEVLADRLEERSITQSAFAKHIGVLPRTINEICHGRRGISADMAIKLSMALGASAEFWMNLQKNWELGRARGQKTRKTKPMAA